jgi:hypothetical protein
MATLRMLSALSLVALMAAGCAAAGVGAVILGGQGRGEEPIPARALTLGPSPTTGEARKRRDGPRGGEGGRTTLALPRDGRGRNDGIRRREGETIPQVASRVFPLAEREAGGANSARGGNLRRDEWRCSLARQAASSPAALRWRADRSFCRLFRRGLILRIPARQSALAGTFDRIGKHSRERLSMYNGGYEMYNIHSRAGPYGASFCEKLPRFPRVFRESETGDGKATSQFRNRSGSLRLRHGATPQGADSAFLSGIHT